MSWGDVVAELVVFDFDGTLAETRMAVSTTVNAAFVAHGLDAVEPGLVHGLMGLPLEALLQRALGWGADADVGHLVRFYRAEFDVLGAPLVAPMAEATAVLDALAGQGRRLAIATSREQSSLGPLLERFGWTGRFEVIGTCDRVTRGKPNPEMLQLVLGEAGVEPGNAVMVGDTTFDVGMARAAGVRVVGVPDGCHDRLALEAAGADVVLESLGGLVTWLG